MDTFKKAAGRKDKAVFSVIGPDPLNVLGSTKPVVENARFAVIDVSKIKHVAGLVQEKLKSGLEAPEISFGKTGNYEDDIQLVFLENAVNFSFWPDQGKPRWSVSVPGRSTGGWYSLVNCFMSAIREGYPILDASRLADFTLEDGRRIFAGDNGEEIPMLKERVKNLKEAGRILNRHFEGLFVNALPEAGYDAVNIAKLLCRYFPSFQDSSGYEGGEAIFLKRAQICAFDLAPTVLARQGKTLSRLDQLTAFADYRLPQILRAEGLVVYAPALARAVDSLESIPSGSLRELEIRAATIWAVELLRQELIGRTAGEIDNALWLLSQSRKDMKPYHRTRTICY
jgi:hypothetical protein